MRLKVLSWLTLSLAGAITYLDHFGWIHPAQTPDLSALATDLGSFHISREFPLRSEDIDVVKPDLFSYREYVGPRGVRSRLFVAYYAGLQQWSELPHNPSVCYRVAGWRILKDGVLPCPSGARIKFGSYQKDEARVLVLAWIQQPDRLPRAPGTLSLPELLASRFALRPDVVHVIWEIDESPEVTPRILTESADRVIDSIATIWAHGR